MKHTRANVQMSLYVDGRLDANGLRQLERHLMSCAACRRDLARMRLPESVLRESDLMARSPLPDRFAEHVMQRVEIYEAERKAAQDWKARQKVARRRAQIAFWRGSGWRLIGAAIALVIAVAIWWRTYPENGIEGAVAHFWADTLQLLTIPGPDEIAWSVWIGGAALALSVCYWLSRAEASAEWRRALAARLPQLW
jgi:anti-sigma factor RsiW